MTTVQTNNVSTALMDAMNGTKSASASATQEAQDRFMTLLVTQMRNQDPLNPMDNAQMTSQLAQLSTVSGIEKLNSTLASLMNDYQSSQSLQSAAMIGRGVLVPGSSIDLQEGKGLMGIELAEPADNVAVTVRDASGTAVYNFSLGAQEAGALPLAWDGSTNAGTTAADGKYTFEIQAKRGGEKVDAKTLAFGQVASVSTGSQGTKINIPGVGAVSMADIRQIL